MKYDSRDSSQRRALLNVEAVLDGGGLVMVVIGPLSFPSPEDSSPCNPINSEGEGSHPEVAVMGFTHLLYIFEAVSHVSPQFIIHFFFIPQETLDVLQV